MKTAEEDGPVIESVAIDERDVNSAESLQEKISKGIRDIFSGNKKKETEEDFMKEEQEAPEEVQEELIKDISSDETDVNVPELEPEDAMIHPPKNPGRLFSAIWRNERAGYRRGNQERSGRTDCPEKIRRYWNQRILWKQLSLLKMLKLRRKIKRLRIQKNSRLK